MAIQHGYVQCSSGKQGSDQCSLWLNIAGANGSEIAREWRDTIEDMTATQIARATEASSSMYCILSWVVWYPTSRAITAPT